MLKNIIVLLCLFLWGCGKPLTPYDYKDALIIKKSIMHRELGNLSQKTMNKITKKRQLLESGSISSEEYRLMVKIIKDNQQSEIIKIQKQYDEYIESNKKN